MPHAPPFAIRQLEPGDVDLVRELLAMFGEAFDDIDGYTASQPSGAYLQRLLGGDRAIVLTALLEGSVVGGLVAYELNKLEQERTEFYLYDLATAAAHRRKGVATALIERLKAVAAARGAYIIFVQADPPDAPAVALYSKLGVCEDVLHFDIEVPDPSARSRST